MAPFIILSSEFAIQYCLDLPVKNMPAPLQLSFPSSRSFLTPSIDNIWMGIPHVPFDGECAQQQKHQSIIYALCRGKTANHSQPLWDSQPLRPQLKVMACIQKCTWLIITHSRWHPLIPKTHRHNATQLVKGHALTNKVSSLYQLESVQRAYREGWITFEQIQEGKGGIGESGIQKWEKVS